MIIDATADVKMAVNSILLSKTFDNGMICASEQAVVVEAAIADAVREDSSGAGPGSPTRGKARPWPKPSFWTAR